MARFNKVFFIFFILFIIYSIVNIAETNVSTINVLNSFSRTILPSLLPFLILNQLVIRCGIIDLLSYFFQFISYPFFKVSGKGASVIIMGILNGFPSSAIFTSIMLKNNQLERTEAQRLVNFIFFPSISFLFAILRPNIGNDSIFILLITSLYLAGFIFLYISSFKENGNNKYVSFRETCKNINYKLKNFIFSIEVKDIIKNAFDTLINILGVVVIFTIPCNIIGNISSSKLVYLFKGLIEFSMSSINLSLLPISKSYIAYGLSIILSFSGLSSIMQASLFIEDAKLSVKKFVISRILVTILSLFLLILFFLF